MLIENVTSRYSSVMQTGEKRTYRTVCVVHHSSSPENEVDRYLPRSYEYSIKVTILKNNIYLHTLA